MSGFVKELKGSATIDGTKAVVHSKVWMDLSIRIDKGFCVVALGGYGLIRLFSGTSVTFNLGKELKEVGLKNGKILASINKLKKSENLNIRTANAVAGVRGTDFIVARKKETTTVGVIQGKVDVSDKKGNSRIVGNNQKVEIAGEQPLSKPAYFNGGLEKTLWEKIVEFFQNIF